MTYKESFIKFMVDSGVLKFGEFTLKSGRLAPYFINAGNYKTGAQLAKLGEFYAECIMENGLKPQTLFGPAYKGIPLSVSACTALYNKHGVFYNICGMKARAIDGPCEYTLPPYNHYAKMAPDKPDEVAERLTKYLGVDVVIIDANDIGANVLGKPRKDMPDEFPIQAFKDNPLDQCSQQTPIAIVRKVS